MLTHTKKCVREHLDLLFDVRSKKELVEKNPPISEEEMNSYLDDEGLLVCTVQRFRVDFERPWKTNVFNKEAKKVFIDSFLDAYLGGAYRETLLPPVLRERKIVGQVLDNHMEYRRKVYHRHLSPLSKEEEFALKKRRAANTRRQTVRGTTRS